MGIILICTIIVGTIISSFIFAMPIMMLLKIVLPLTVIAICGYCAGAIDMKDYFNKRKEE